MRLLFVRLAAAGLLLASTAVACSTSVTGGSSSGTPPDNASSSNGSSGTSSGGSGSSGSKPPPPPEEFVKVTAETMEFDGSTRHYFLAKPKDYDAAKTYPLVMSFHGNPGTAAGLKDGLPFDSVSKTTAVIAYPQGWGDNWDLYTPTDTNADMNFIKALIDEIKTKANIDKAKVLAFGYSGGGFFITQFACRFQGIFKAISVNAGGGPDEAQMGFTKKANECYVCPGGPTPTIVTHGAADNVIDPLSGEFTADCFADTNGCGGSRSPSTPEPCQQYEGCPADKPVKWCLIPGQDHGVWRDSMKEAWAFFNALP